jgi:glycosyltransferase involved in cell wall biosynthesis
LYKGHKVSVVVPAHNEEGQIGKVIQSTPEFIDYIVIVDDKSSDGTAAVVQAYRENDPKIILIRHEENQGVGGAIASGYKWSRDNDIDTAVVMAGDAQMDPADLPVILDPVVEDQVDYSKGNRLVYKDAYQLIPKVRFFGNSVLSLLTKVASGYWHIADSQTGYAAISKKALHLINWDNMYKRYGQPNDVLVKLNVYDLKVRDVPIRPVYNVGEKSGIKVRKVLFSISWLLVRLFIWRLVIKYIVKDFHPLVFFYAWGFLMFLLGLVLLVRLAVLWPVEGMAPSMTAMAMLFAFSMSMQSIFFAMLFDMETNRHLR